MLPEILKVAATKTSSSFKPSSSLLRPVMYFFTILLLSFLFAAVSACPLDDEQLSVITLSIGEKFSKDICGQGIKPGGQADVDWVTKIIIAYYLNKKWLSKDLPTGLQKAPDKILANCHKNSYNYCDPDVQKAVGDCVKGMASSLMLKYGATAMSYCPILDKKVINWNTSGDMSIVLQFFTQYCATKGKKC